MRNSGLAHPFSLTMISMSYMMRMLDAKGTRRMTTYGYARVSTTGQDLTSQRTQLKAAGCDKIFEEKQSGAGLKNRKQLSKALAALEEGNVLIVTALDRLARSNRDLW